MAAPIPSPSALRALRASIQPKLRQSTQIRHATLLRRPKRPYTFTQLITLSDGSSFTLRTTNPSLSQKLLNVEEDEAGKLAAFRAKFGRGWDAETENAEEKSGEDHLLDLISASQGKSAPAKKEAPKAAPAAEPAAPEKGGKKK